MARTNKSLTVQWYSDDGSAKVFHGEDCIAELPCGDRIDAAHRLRVLGLRPTRWFSMDWGFEAALYRATGVKRSAGHQDSIETK